MAALKQLRTRRRNAGPYLGKGLNALTIARECVQLGARKKTIELITGLPATFILRWVFDRKIGPPKGRPAYSDDFLDRAPLSLQTAASAFAARYERLRESDFPPAQSLITAYRHYVSFPDAPALLFDEAFYLCCNLEGIWACRSKSLQVASCRRCDSRHLQPYGSASTPTCAFCNSRRTDDARGNRHGFDADTDPQRVALGLDARIKALKRRDFLKQLGASERTIDVLMSGMADIDALLRPPAPSTLVYVGLPLPLRQWGAHLKTVRRVQYSLVASQYTALRLAGFAAEESVIAAYRHLEPRFRDAPPLTLDRCVELISLTEGCWGVALPELELRSCGPCGASYLVSLRDTSSVQSCPFCLLRRFPSQYRGSREAACTGFVDAF